MTVELIFTSLAARQRSFAEAQEYIDNRCVQLMEPYVPVALSFYRNAGRLRDSVQITSPGFIEYTAPRAEHDYYVLPPEVDHRNGGNPDAQPMWFDFMKQRHIRELAKGVGEITGCKVVIT